MKERLAGLLKTYVAFLCVFIVQKPLFMWYYSQQYYDDCTALDWLRVMWHGLPLDLSLAGYLTVIPGLLYLCSSWSLSRLLHRIWCGYFCIISILLSVAFVVDLCLYEYWGFRLDTTPLFYFFSSPKDTMASISVWMLLGGVIVMVVYALLLYGVFYALLLQKRRLLRMKLPYRRVRVSLVLLLCVGLLFIPIRGGFTVSTMNTGKVYFSSDQRLNHAAINPVFSLMESLSKQKDFAAQYRFMDDADAEQVFATMLDPSVSAGAAARNAAGRQLSDTLFNTTRPDVFFIILESFSAHLMESLGGEPGIAVQLDSLAAEGILFTDFYANSFRTDRGLVAILSGYPAQPTTSIMKYPRKSQTLPSIARSLQRAGYHAKYYYGGDADFTNMRSYLMSSGFEEVVSDQDFPMSERLSKWGVHDHLVFDRLLADLKAEPDSLSRFYVLQTSSSHEPYEVPYRRLQDDRKNCFAYADSCVGDFIRQFRALPQWKHSVVVLVPDHQGVYPIGLSNFSAERYHIPLLMVGGAVRRPARIDVYGSQQDIAATLLSQLCLPHDEFLFSKDLLDEASPHFAFFTVPDAFGVLTPDNRLIYDCQGDKVVLDEGAERGKNLPKGKAYLQKLYDDIANR